MHKKMCRQPQKKKKDLKKITEKYVSGKLHDTVYMSLVDSWAASELDKGVYYSTSKMPDNLKHYEKIAWSKKEYGSYRIDYFLILLNNAYLSGKWGSSIFYSEKVARQGEKEGMPRPFIESSVKMYIYGVTGRKIGKLKLTKNIRNLFKIWR